MKVFLCFFGIHLLKERGRLWYSSKNQQIEVAYFRFCECGKRHTKAILQQGKTNIP